MVELLEESAVLQLFEGGLLVRLDHLADRHAGAPQRVDDLVGLASAAPRREVVVDRIVGGDTTGGGRQCGVGGPRGITERGAQRAPLVVVGDGDRHPDVVAALRWCGRLVEVLRRRARAAVAGAGEQRAVRGVLDHLLGGDVQRGVDHRRLDERTLAGAVAVAERDEQADQRVEPGVGVADPVRLVREQIGMPGQPGQARRVLDDERERGEVAPWSVETEAGHADHHEVGLDGAERLVVEPGTVEHPRRVVLDDDVARGRDPLDELDATRVGEVDRQALLVRVERGEDRAALPVLRLGLRHAADEAHAVGSLRRLDVDHLRAEQREDVPDERARPERRHVEHPQALERQGETFGA